LNFKGRIERDDWTGQAKALLAEATADEVPAEDDEVAQAEASETAESAEAAEAAEKPAKKSKKKKDA
jgi:hypothetical protein